MKRSLRLGVLLTALVGINVYVFFFNRGTAPREILNLQSTSKTFETSKQETLAADVRKAGDLIASASGAGRAARHQRSRRPAAGRSRCPRRPQAPAPAPSARARPRRQAAGGPGRPRGGSAAGDSHPVRAAVRFARVARARARMRIEIPFAPPPEDDGAAGERRGNRSRKAVRRRRHPRAR